MTRVYNSKSIAGICAAAFLFMFVSSPLKSQENNSVDPFAKFDEHTADSDLVINHWVWSTFLYDAVIVITPSSRKKSNSKNIASTGTKIQRGSRSSARDEGNRILYHAITEDHLSLISKYRHELELLPNYFPLSFFSKDEQLAYWLNLHNAILVGELVKRYPISKLKKLRSGKKSVSLWDEKLVTVEGVSLSLNDIQNNILIRHWQSPMVLYGLYQGSIGGPSLPNRAFTGANVHTLLEHTAKEFVNSNRGFKNWGNETKVSLIYDWGRAAFSDWERDLTKHLMDYTNVKNQSDLANSERLVAKLYDWGIADTKGGTLSAGPKHSTAASLLTLGKADNVDGINAQDLAIQPQVGDPTLIRNTDTSPIPFDSSRTSNFSNRGGITQMLTNLKRNNMIMPGAYSSETVDLLRAIKQKLEERPEGTVTSIECAPEDDTCGDEE